MLPCPDNMIVAIHSFQAMAQTNLSGEAHNIDVKGQNTKIIYSAPVPCIVRLMCNKNMKQVPYNFCTGQDFQGEGQSFKVKRQKVKMTQLCRGPMFLSAILTKYYFTLLSST